MEKKSPIVIEQLDSTMTSEQSSPSSSAVTSPMSSRPASMKRLLVGRIEVNEPYNVFTSRLKWTIIIIIGTAGLFSGLSSNIYFPSLDIIAHDLHVSIQSVNLTITSYLIIQAISPLVWGSFSDAIGRRPIYIASFSVYIIANILLSLSPSFAVLIVFRGVQAAGSASTVSIGNGVIQDISPPSERGSYISFYQAIRNFSIAVGPVLGGILAQYLGFRAIFVFLLILSSLTLGTIIVLLPETMRRIAGNGSVTLNGIYKPLININKAPTSQPEPGSEAAGAKPRVTIMTFVDPILLLAEKDIATNLVFGGVVYTIWSMVTSSTTVLFQDTFGLNQLQVGLAYLPNGIGTILGSTLAGKLMSKEWANTEAAYIAKHNLGVDYKVPSKKSIPIDFPIERSRMRHIPWVSAVFIASTVGYGFSLAYPAATNLTGWIAVPLVLQLLIAGASNAVFAFNQTLIADICPGKGASATAVNNLVRCGLGALGVAFVDQLIGALGPGYAFLVLGGLVIVCAPLILMNWCFGMHWRAERMARKKAAKAQALKKQRLGSTMSRTAMVV